MEGTGTGYKYCSGSGAWEVDPYSGTLLDRADGQSLPHPQLGTDNKFIQFLDSFLGLFANPPNSITPIYILVLSEGGDFSTVCTALNTCTFSRPEFEDWQKVPIYPTLRESRL